LLRRRRRIFSLLLSASACPARRPAALAATPAATRTAPALH